MRQATAKDDESVISDASEQRMRASTWGRARVDRYILSQDTARFMQNPAVFERLRSGGTAILPLTAVNGRVVPEGWYPSQELCREIDAALAAAASGRNAGN